MSKQWRGNEQLGFHRQARLLLCQTEFQILMFSVSLKRCLPECFYEMKLNGKNCPTTYRLASKSCYKVIRLIRDNYHISKSKAFDAPFADHSCEGPERIVGIEESGCPAICQYNCNKLINKSNNNNNNNNLIFNTKP